MALTRRLSAPQSLEQTAELPLAGRDPEPGWFIMDDPACLYYCLLYIPNMPIKTLPSRSEQLMVRLDSASKKFLHQAAQLRNVSVSDYVRLVAVVQARREVKEAVNHTIVLTSDEQLAFWKALNEEPRLTQRQRKLGSIMRGAA